MTSHHARPFELRDFENPALTIADMARPLSAMEIGRRVWGSYQTQIERGELGWSIHGSDSASNMMKRARNKVRAAKKWREREKRQRATELIDG